jgi:hypothetical protein
VTHGAARDVHLVLAELRPVDRPVVVVPERVGQVLVQRAAVRHTQQLHAATDAQQRKVGLQGGTHQHQLGAVALRPDLGRGVRGFTVQRGIDVGTTGEDDAVEAVEDVDVRIVRCDEHGPTTAGVHRVHVREWQHRGERVVDPEPGFLGVRGQPDHGPRR